MTFSEAIRLIYQKKRLVFWITVLGAVLFFDILVLQTPKYEASSRILVVQKQVEGQDIYSTSKSAQYISGILKEAVYSDVFFERAVDSSAQLGMTDFPESTKKRRQEWGKAVKVKIARDLGIIGIDTFYKEAGRTDNINRAVINTLISDHRLYHGSGNNVELKVLNYPLASQKPNTLRLWLGTFLGALIGFIVSLIIIFRKTAKKEASSLDRSIPKKEGVRYEEVPDSYQSNCWQKATKDEPPMHGEESAF